MDYTTPAPVCLNKISDAQCNDYKSWACTQDDKTIKFMKKNCKKACGWC